MSEFKTPIEEIIDFEVAMINFGNQRFIEGRNKALEMAMEEFYTDEQYTGFKVQNKIIKLKLHKELLP